MFCKQCGSQVADGTPFCPNCGTQLSGSQAASAQPYEQQVQQAQPYQQPAQQYQQPAQQPYQQQPYQQQTYQQPYQQPAQQPYGGQSAPNVYANPGINPEYHKLGGWLLALVIVQILGIIGGLAGIINTASEWSSVSSLLAYAGYGSLNTFMIVFIILGTAELVAEAVFVYFILARKDIFLKFYQIVAIADIALVLLMGIAIAAMPELNSMASDFFSEVGGSLVGSVVGLILFTLYFCKSVRVRTYMGSTSYLDKALFKIGA